MILANVELERKFTQVTIYNRGFEELSRRLKVLSNLLYKCLKVVNLADIVGIIWHSLNSLIDLISMLKIVLEFVSPY